ncbi:MAG: two-component system, chemotaxis family, sensor histidine kinase and response regulator WspE, partial [Candidatus Hydrogenedentes bacterium]|nr:two-component system, chemotaxis family, sensor histidine kinase and response regulator WspE [Candidatus Hydrogenedentota bacterium]
MTAPDLSGFSMLDLFRQETETQAHILNDGLLALESDPGNLVRLEALMRAAHSIKGAARIVGLDAGVEVAHAMEDCFVAAQKGVFVLSPDDADVLLRGVDMLCRIAAASDTEMPTWKTANQADLDALMAQLKSVGKGEAPAPKPPDAPTPPPSPPPPSPVPAVEETPEPAHAAPEQADAKLTVRVASDNLSRMLGMIGETLVQSRWYDSFVLRLLTLKNRQSAVSRLLERTIALQKEGANNGSIETRLEEIRLKAEDCRRLEIDCLEDFDSFARRSSDLAGRLYRESLISRMRPFSDGVQAFPRMVRDLARKLDKKVRFEILGQTTGVDREILEKLEAPLTHMLRNALDHGIEPPADRLAADKPETGLLKLEARHHAGLLHITVSDDGRGVDINRIRQKTIDRGYCTEEVAGRLSETEVL